MRVTHKWIQNGPLIFSEVFLKKLRVCLARDINIDKIKAKGKRLNMYLPNMSLA
jgi:hypothetical protein